MQDVSLVNISMRNTIEPNRKVISDLRQQTRERLQQEQGEGYKNALAAKEAVEKYWKAKDK